MNEESKKVKRVDLDNISDQTLQLMSALNSRMESLKLQASSVEREMRNLLSVIVLEKELDGFPAYIAEENKIVLYVSEEQTEEQQIENV